MHVGALIFATDYTIRMDELAVAMEERGFESLFLPEHTHIPASRLSPWPGGADLPSDYWHTHDPFVALAYAGAVTKNLKLGTGICLLAQREAIVTAKNVASLDMMSNGRFIFGIGGGWNVEEMNDHGVEYKNRFAQIKDQVLAMKALWTEEDAARAFQLKLDAFFATPVDPRILLQELASAEKGEPSESRANDSVRGPAVQQTLSDDRRHSDQNADLPGGRAEP